MSEQLFEADPSAARARLEQVAGDGGTVEVILVVRGSVRQVSGSGGRRWRMRLDGERVLTFSAEWVAAARSVPGQRGK